MPDLNSLPPSPSPSHSPAIPAPVQIASPAASRPRRMSHSSSPQATHSLAAAAALNAGIQQESTRHPSPSSMRREVDRARRRSSIRLNLNLNDPAMPGPGELHYSPSSRTGWPSPHHERAPSLGELHQELENEQEAQVNRLLSMIRQQQAQIERLQAQNTSAIAEDNNTPPSSEQRSPLLFQTQLANAPHTRSRSPIAPHHPRTTGGSSYLDRSRGSSRTGSPALRPVPTPGSDITPDWSLGAGPALSSSASSMSRDESAFYQAETQNLTRENQMLKLRIRELERQLADLNRPTSPAASAHEPARPSGLASSPALRPSSTPTPPAQAQAQTSEPAPSVPLQDVPAPAASG